MISTGLAPAGQAANDRHAVRRYDVRSTDGKEWLGTFLVTNDGLVCCNTDYGNYSYWWTSIGQQTIQEFLIGAGTDYLLRKFSPEDVYDGDGTLAAIKQAIVRARRDGGLTRRAARRHWNKLEDYDIEGSEFGFASWLGDSDLSPESWEFIRRKPEPQAVSFLGRVWPRFCDALRAEMGGAGQDALAQTVEQARHAVMTSEQLEAQRRSFVFGNTHIENPRITREMIDDAADGGDGVNHG